LINQGWTFGGAQVVLAEGIAQMAAFEWLELQTLTNDIASARSRLAAAKTDRDDRRIRILEQEITVAEGRRIGLLASLSDHLAVVTDAEANEAVSPFVGGVTASDEDGPSIVLDPADPGDESGVGEVAQRVFLQAAGDQRKREVTMWDQLTPGDLDRARQELEAQHNEMLARHAEELRGLDADRDQLASLEAAIAEFLRRFGGAPGDDAVIRLGIEGERRAAG
jgi:hypothetical protein